MPDNVHLHEQDVFGSWPEEWHAKFDVVNIRLMITLLQQAEAFEKLMAGLSKILSEF